MYFKENIEANWASSFKIRAKIKKRAILGASHLADEHRRTGNFLPGGGGKPFAQKNLASCPNFSERVEKK